MLSRGALACLRSQQHSELLPVMGPSLREVARPDIVGVAGGSNPSAVVAIIAFGSPAKIILLGDLDRPNGLRNQTITVL
jgi:hypothetical protein